MPSHAARAPPLSPRLDDASSTASGWSEDTPRFANATVKTLTIDASPVDADDAGAPLSREALATSYFDKLHREHDDALGTLALVRTELDSTKRTLGRYKRAFGDLDAGDAGEGGERKKLEADLAASVRDGKAKAAEARRLKLRDERWRRTAKNAMYASILHSALVEPHDRVVIHYTRPECIGVGAVQPRPDDEFATGINIRASVCEHDGTIIDAVVPSESVQIVDQDNLEDVLQMVLAKDNLAGLAKRAKGKHESTAAFARRVATQTLADLKSSNALKKQTHLVDACEALYAPTL